MKRVLLLILLFSVASLQAQTTAIPDSYFEMKLIDLGIDSDGTVNGEVLTDDIEGVTELHLEYSQIHNLEGIEDFTNLEVLDIAYNDLLNLDISANTQLRVLDISVNYLKEIDVSQNILLEELYVKNDEGELDHWYNEIRVLDLSQNTNLRILECDLNRIEELNLENCLQLEELSVTFTSVEELDLSNNSELKKLTLGYYYYNVYDEEVIPSNYFLTEIDLSANVNLETLMAENTYLTSVNLKSGANNQLTEVNLTHNNDLSCIEIDDEAAANDNQLPYSNWEKDDDAIYSEDCALDTEAFQQNISFQIYPNPTQDVFQLKTTSDRAVDEVLVYSLTGKKLLSFKPNSSYDISQLSSGIYLVEVRHENDQTLTKIVKK